METRCEGCDSPVGAGQAFCPRCGAVIGMADAGEQKRDEGWDMQTTMVGRKPARKPAPRTAPEQAPPVAPAQPPAAHGKAPDAGKAVTARPAVVSAKAPATVPGAAQASKPAPAPRGVNLVLLAVIVFVAVLLIGGVLLLFR